MAHVNVIYGNHKNFSGIQDHIEYFSQGIFSVDAPLEINEANWFAGATNVIVEGNENNYYPQLINLKKNTKDSKLIVIVTEIIKNGRFNSANSSHVYATNLYDNQYYWTKRYEDFLSLLPYVDGFVCVSETLISEYEKLNKPLFYLPMACPQGFQKLTRVNRDQQYIDFLFSGTQTPYREKIISNLESKGFRVKVISPATTDYYREYYHSRAKLTIAPRLDANTKIISKMRAYYLLSRRIPHLFERTEEITDLHPYIEFCSSNDKFVEECIEKIATESNIEERFLRFVKEPQLNYHKIFRKLIQFIDSI